jgi:DNA-binding CsgD family transcriptional regulator
LAARLGRLEGGPSAAETFAHEGLKAAADIDAKARTVDALEVLVGLATDLTSYQEAARLLGAARAIRDRTGYARCISERDNDLAAVTAGLGSDHFEVAYNEGRALSVDEAAANARRRRGQRKRPSTGWASLSAAETQVVALVAEGLNNPQIAKRLLCSPRTVQAHFCEVSDLQPGRAPYGPIGGR